MKRLIAGAAVLCLIAAACAESGAQALGPAPGPASSSEPTATGTVTRSPSPSPTETISPTKTSSPTSTPETTATVVVWFYYDGYLFPASRTVGSPAVATGAMQELLAGPTAEERSADLSTGVQDGTKLIGLSIRAGVATVDLNAAFTSEQTPALSVMRLSQVVYTLTQFASVDSVRFEVGGKTLTNLGGYELDGPQTSADFADAIPAILVESPGIGDRVDSPVAISGTADVFEAVVSIVILDADGNVVTSAFTNGTCGTGCRGTFSTLVRYSLDRTQPGTIRVFESSAKDGSPINVVEIPVTLAA